ncbi:fatty acid desaturase [Streptomyces sp. H39-S7]|uniref:fatty acid desaturase n=1 Tax=Streptomyces sp. H39-S7 TaxID=3004357 RepID=UPI0022AFC064|nr:fatty acid desaturase [Streptomyces sp. H39-S7]MCZ4124984.1 fatty acid desaturase [Streptomyces sp. H39-S7]
MLTYWGIIAAGIIMRQADRWHFSPYRGRHRPNTLRAVMSLQRARLNNATPVLLLAGHWVELAGWCLIAAHAGPWGWAVAAAAGAVKFRHLQEVSHFAVHGVLTRSSRLGTVLSEAAVHVPLGFVPVPVRRQRHVREHHPNATLAGIDPNLGDLHTARLLPGVTRFRFAVALVFPLTPQGIAETVRGILANLRTSRAPVWRLAALVAVPALMGCAFGWPAAVFVYVVPRLLLYPQLAWMSLLVEHRWFDAEPVTGPPAVVEAARCLRLYPRNHLLALIARGTWLPYGDLFHYAHSAHPAVRWNYLPTLDRALGTPHFTPTGLLLGPESVARRHLAALTTSTDDTMAKAAAPARSL